MNRHARNLHSFVLSKLLYGFKRNFTHQWRLPNALHGWSRDTYNKWKMVDGSHLEKLNDLNIYNYMTGFDEICQCDASWPSGPNQPIKLQCHVRLLHCQCRDDCDLCLCVEPTMRCSLIQTASCRLCRKCLVSTINSSGLLVQLLWSEPVDQRCFESLMSLHKTCSCCLTSFLWSYSMLGRVIKNSSSVDDQSKFLGAW